MTSDTPKTPDEEIIEELAAIEHERWADWQSWVQRTRCNVNSNGDYIIPASDAERWARQIVTPYADLPEAEKQSDRDQVMRYWPLLKAREQRIVNEARMQEPEHFFDKVVFDDTILHKKSWRCMCGNEYDDPDKMNRHIHWQELRLAQLKNNPMADDSGEA